MVDGVPGGTDSARQKKKSERELDEERGHVQNTSQLLSDAWFIAVLLPRQETAKKKKKFLPFPFQKLSFKYAILFSKQTHLRYVLLQPSHLLHHASCMIPSLLLSPYQCLWLSASLCALTCKTLLGEV